MFLTGMFLYRL
uniref:Uncharacterized protein n=1 Tax=Anguilla anguilla TaxID=7936 RepID=A0A0E9VRP8_ANGAN